MDPRILGAQINSALYLGFVAWVGVMTGAHAATYVAIAAMGVTYLTYMVQADAQYRNEFSALGQAGKDVQNVLLGISILLGAAAGILLLV